MREIMQIVRLLMVATLMLPAVNHKSESELEAFDKELDKTFTMFSALSDTVDVSEIEIEALEEKMEFDVNKTIAFVRENIAYESYVGLLRGDVGTLLSQSGNALDQSYLLSVLLRDLGYDVQIKHGKLSEQDTKTLLYSMFDTQSLPTGLQIKKIKNVLSGYVKDEAKVTQLMKEFTHSYGQSKDANETISTIADTLNVLLEKKNVWALGTEQDASLLAEASDYYWIEYKLGKGTNWQAVHPAFSKYIAPKNVPKILNTFTSKIADTLLHKVKVDLLIDHVAGGKLQTDKLMASYEGPLAQLINAPLNIKLLPSSGGSREAVIKSQFFIPTLNGKVANGGKAFNREGRLVDPSLLSGEVGGAGALFSTVSSKMVGGLDALGSIDKAEKSQKSFTLVSVYLQITITSPGKKEKIQKHYLLDLKDYKEQTKLKVLTSIGDQERFDALTPSITVMLYGGRIKSGKALKSYLSMLMDRKAVFELLGKKIRWPNETVVISQKEIDKISNAWALESSFISNLLSTQNNSKVVNYRDEAVVVIHKLGSVYAKDVHNIIDILNNPIRSYSLNGKKEIKWNHRAVLSQGIKDTFNETFLASDEAQNASKIPTDILKKSQLLVALDDVKKLNLKDKKLEKVLLDEIKSGFLLVFPKQDDLKYYAWWKVNRETGQTLGMIDYGLGGEAIGYVNMLQIEASFLNAFVGCAGSGFDTKACVGNFAMFAYGAPVGPLGATMQNAHGLAQVIQVLTTDLLPLVAEDLVK